MMVVQRALLFFAVCSGLISYNTAQAELEFIDQNLVDAHTKNDYQISLDISSDPDGNINYSAGANVSYPSGVGFNLGHSESNATRSNISIDTRSDIIGVSVQYKDPVSIALEYEEWSDSNRLETQLVRAMLTLGDDISVTLVPERRKIMLHLAARIIERYSDGLGITLQLNHIGKFNLYANYHQWDYDFETQQLQIFAIYQWLWANNYQRRVIRRSLSVISSFSTESMGAGISYQFSWADISYDWARSDSILDDTISYSNRLTISKQWTDNWLIATSFNRSNSDDSSNASTDYYALSFVYSF